MNYLQQYQNFLRGRFFYEGIRVAIGFLIPVLVFSLIGDISTGLILLIGALCVSAADNPGPMNHRLNGMAAIAVMAPFLAFITPFIAQYSTLIMIFLGVAGFFFSMLTVYGARLSSIGIAALLVIILSMDLPFRMGSVTRYALLIGAGGLWYLVYSYFIHSIRPYKIIQQVLGDYIIETGEYFETRAAFYHPDPELEETYQALFHKQIEIEKHQTLLSELLFRTREIIRESTTTSRRLLKIYIDINDLLSDIMSSFQDYRQLHKHFDDSGLLPKFEHYIISLSAELKTLGFYVKAGKKLVPREALEVEFKSLKLDYDAYRDAHLKPENIEHYVALGRILVNLQHIKERIQQISYYTDLKQRVVASGAGQEFAAQAEKTDIRPAIFVNNLSWHSNIFRHSLRVALALVTGYFVSMILHLERDYWILLTIVVILKPAYSLTKKRNRDRLLGTFLGILIGAGILYVIKDQNVLLVILVLLMIGTYSFLRINYFLAVILMTPYLVIYFHFLHPANVESLLKQRILDTAIGSLISFIAARLIVPYWEKLGVNNFMLQLLEGNRDYFRSFSGYFVDGNTEAEVEIGIKRKKLLVALANMSDSFNRMLSEPKNYQKEPELVHRFLVLNHIFVSHQATLAFFRSKKNPFKSTALQPLKNNIEQSLAGAIDILHGDKFEPPAGNKANDEANLLVANMLEARKLEVNRGEMKTDTRKALVNAKPVVDQFNFLDNIAKELINVTAKYFKA